MLGGAVTAVPSLPGFLLDEAERGGADAVSAVLARYGIEAGPAPLHASQTITASAVYGNELNLAGIYAGIHNQDVVPPPADTPLWKLTASAVTTASGIHSSILGPWKTMAYIDTTTSSPAGQVVMDASVLSNQGHNFGVWLHHR